MSTSIIIRSSAHALPQWRNCGGGRRSEQLEEILTKHGLTWSDAVEAPPASRSQLLRAAWKLRMGRPPIKMRLDRSIVRHLASDYLRFQSTLRHAPAGTVLLIEEAVDYGRIRAARDAGVPIVAAPHNFETLQQSPPRDYYSGEPMPTCLQREINFLALANVVFCISREEQWLLANQNVTTDFLPYFPPASARAQLLRIRMRRKQTAPSNELFAFTTGSNAKNREGLQALARLMTQVPPSSGFHLHVGGFDTESLRAHFSGRHCTFHGAIDNEALEQLMIRCRASIVYQRSGTGALTRIPELLYAGIPVFASSHAARSAYHLDGVRVFDTAEDLVRLCAHELPTPREPLPDIAAEDRFAGWFRQLASQTQS